MVNGAANHIIGHGIGSKMNAPNKGPCKIVAKLSPSTFIVIRLRDNANLGVVNAGRIKPFYGSTESKQSESKLTGTKVEHTVTTLKTNQYIQNSQTVVAVRSSNRKHRASIRYGQ